jgi:LysR family transcriptional regulator, regulator for genes of the gallate degradation pathway
MPDKTVLPIPGISLRHLRSFAAVLEAGSVTAAGAALRRSPSSVSRSVALLEQGLGAALLDRSAFGLTPTVEGRLVAGRCATIRAELDRCKTQLGRDHRAGLRDNAAVFAMLADLAHLRALIAVDDHHSVQRAADQLGLTQPAVSYSLRQLEADLGLALFTRLTTGMAATPAGAAMSLCARRIIAEIARIHDDIRSAGGIPSGIVRVGGLPYSRGVLLPDAIKMVLAREGGVEIRTVEGPIETMISALRIDEIDALICAYPERRLLEGIEVEQIAEDQLGFFVSHDHPLADRRRLALSNLTAHSFILPPSGSITRRMMEEFFAASGLPPPVGRAETSSSSLIRNLLRGSDYIAFRSMREFSEQIPDSRIVGLDIDMTLPTRTICVLRRQGSVPTAAVQVFLSALREVGRSVLAH